jgi:acetylornithine deacetylase/succinyl-diaminopimelate desuccinylase-like protein
MMLNTKQYIEAHQNRFLVELMDFLRIPSVSTSREYEEDLQKAAEFVKKKLLEAGTDQTRLIETKGCPLVYGEKMIGKSLPTVLVYGHYDVQPADPYELWETPPFEPVVKEDKIYARGASDDKGQVYMHIKALETMLATKRLPCNVKFLIEGEEESGSEGLTHFLKDPKNKALLQADVVLVSDTTLISLEQPSLTIGLRGIIYLEVEVTGPNRDLHSGAYGGAVGNPINILCQMLSSLKDEHHRITIPGFYNSVAVLSEIERTALNQIPFVLSKYKEDLGIEAVMGEQGYSTIERIGIRPSLDINGIWGGYTGEGGKTVLPSKAHAKLSMRLVPHQEEQEITAQFTNYFAALAPKGVKVQVKVVHVGSNAVVVNSDSVALRAAKKAFEEVWEKSPVLTRDGGSIPIVAQFKEAIGCDTVLMGFGLDSDAIHSPNEHFGLANFFKGIDTVIAFYQHLVALCT